MKGYVFVYGVDGFGANVAPALEEGVYTDYQKAFEKQCKLNYSENEKTECLFFEEGYGEDYWPDNDTTLNNLEEAGNWDGIEDELLKHLITDVSEVCKRINEYVEPPFGFYQLQEVEIFTD